MNCFAEREVENKWAQTDIYPPVRNWNTWTFPASSSFFFFIRFPLSCISNFLTFCLLLNESALIINLNPHLKGFLSCPPFLSVHQCLCLSSSVPCYSSSFPVHPNHTTTSSYCQKEKWERGTLRDTMQALTVMGLWGGRLDIKTA